MDFKDIFKDQLADNKPYTYQQIDFMIKTKTARMKLKDLAKAGAYLKSKIGVQRLEYSYTPKGSGNPLPVSEKVWADELNTLDVKLKGYKHVGYSNSVPVFVPQ